MIVLGKINWDSMLHTICNGVFLLAGVSLGGFLERSRVKRERLKDTRYRLLVLLRQLQVQIATEVNRRKLECTKDGNGSFGGIDMMLKLVLGEVTHPLQNEILDVLRRHDRLPELKIIRQALWCPGVGAEKWLVAITKAISVLEQCVCPRLRALENDFYAELPENIREAIEHPETLSGSKDTLHSRQK